MSELMKRAEAASNWRLIHGMVARRENGEMFTFVGHNGNGTPVWCGFDGRIADFPLEIDFDHPATKGCLLFLVREVHGDPGITTEFTGSMLYDWCVVGSGGYKRTDGMHITIKHDTEADALITALGVVGMR